MYLSSSVSEPAIDSALREPDPSATLVIRNISSDVQVPVVLLVRLRVVWHVVLATVATLVTLSY